MLQKLKSKLSLIALTLCLTIVPFLCFAQTEAAGEWVYDKLYTMYSPSGHAFNEQISWRILSQSGDTATIEIRDSTWSNHPNGTCWTGHTLLYDNGSYIGKIHVPMDYHRIWGVESVSTTVTLKGYGQHHITTKNEDFNDTTISTANADFYINIPKPMYTLKITGDAGVERIEGNGTYVADTKVTTKYHLKPGYVLASETGTCWDNDSTCSWQDNVGKSGVIEDVWPMTRNRTAKITTKLMQFDVVYNGNGGTYNGSSTHKDNVIYGQDYTVRKNDNFFTRPGYTFVGWNTKADGSGQSWTGDIGVPIKWNFNSGVTLYAQWVLNNYDYTVIYKSSSGKILGQKTYTQELNTSKVITPPTFLGYKTPATTTIYWNKPQNQTIELIYPLINYNISYDYAGGSNPGNPTTFNVETPTFTLKEPIKRGYTFTGWTGSNGNTPQTEISILTGSTENRNYKANWAPKKLVIHYDTQGGTPNLPDQVKTFGQKLWLHSELPTKFRNFFYSWNLKPDGTDTDYDAGAVWGKPEDDRFFKH